MTDKNEANLDTNSASNKKRKVEKTNAYNINYTIDELYDLFPQSQDPFQLLRQFNILEQDLEVGANINTIKSFIAYFNKQFLAKDDKKVVCTRTLKQAISKCLFEYIELLHHEANSYQLSRKTALKNKLAQVKEEIKFSSLSPLFQKRYIFSWQ